MYSSHPFSHNRGEVFTMKKIILLLVISFLHPTYSFANEEELTEECKKMLEETRAHYIQLVNSDVLSSFNLLTEDVERNSIYFTASDLWKNEFLVGKNKAIYSLKNLMSGKYIGEKRLYFFNQNPEKGYILYKDINDNNIMLTIQKNENEWVVVNKEEKEGKKINIETVKCDDQHFMQKMFDNLYP